MEIKNNHRWEATPKTNTNETLFQRFVWNLLPVLIIASIALAGCSGRSRGRAIKEAIQNVKETMDVALPDIVHPEPYKYTGGGGDCAWVPEMTSSKETLRYQVEVPLPVGDDGHERQARAVQHWIAKGGKLRTLPYPNGPPSEVDYDGGSILAFAMTTRGRTQDPKGPATFYIVATTPCVPKED
jgi:hypothetical protein